MKVLLAYVVIKATIIEIEIISNNHDDNNSNNDN